MNWFYRFALAAAAIPVLAFAFMAAPRADEAPRALPKATVQEASPPSGLETAVLAGGCFWGVEGVYQHVKGVKWVRAGYSGGTRATANYADVSSESTNHAESVEIKFDPRVVSYGEILRVFFSVAHDPTEKDRQGPDSGRSYRSDIFYTSPEQQKVAQAYIAQLNAAHVFSQPVATSVDRMSGFYLAEASHQDFLIHHPDYPYIVVNDLPKIANLKKLLPEDYRDQPVTDDMPA